MKTGGRTEHRGFQQDPLGNRDFSGQRADTRPHEGIWKHPWLGKGLKNMTFGVKEPSKNSLASATFRHSFFLLHINYPDAVPKKKGWPGWGGGQTHEGLNRCCCLLTKANSSVTRPQT